MKNNKGFTLIELLATIIVLTIVGGIAYPVYTELTQQNKDDIFRNNIKGMINSVRTIEVVEQGLTGGCVKDTDTKGTKLTGTWRLVGDTIVVYNVSDGVRSVEQVDEDSLGEPFEINRTPLEDTCIVE